MSKPTGILEDVQQQEMVKELCDEVRALLAESQFTASQAVIEVNHKIGKTITTHPAYKKGAHGNGNVIKQVAIITGKSESHLHHCIKFFEKYPKLEEALSEIAPDSKSVSWHQIVHSLANERDEECKHDDIYIVQYEVCRGCGIKTKLT